MAYGRPTVERRQLGLTLKRLREQAKKSQQDAANAIGKARTRITQAESGTGSLSTADLETLLGFYAVEGKDRQIVLALGAETRKRQPRRAYTDLLPGSFQRFADLEADAIKVFCYESGVVPGLLQSRSYVYALIDAADNVWWEPSEDMRENRATFRLDRQRRTLKANKSKTLHFVIGEAALNDVVGSPDVMPEQLRHLLSLIDSQPSLTVQVLPTTIQNNPARGGGLTVLDFGISAPRVGFASVVYGPSTYYGEDVDTAALLRTFKRFRELALSPDESKQLIRKKLEGN